MFAHAALADPRDGRLLHDQRAARAGFGLAEAREDATDVSVDDWSLRATPDGYAARIPARDFTLELAFRETQPILLQGDRGYSIKSDQGQASYYYSQPFYRVAGTLHLPEGPVQVTGQAWLDREWSSQPLAEDQSGWDWFSLHFDGGAKLMGFRLRDSGDGFTSATWITADGRSESIAPGALKLTPLETEHVAGRDVPVRWRVELPGKGVDITTTPLNRQSWMATLFPYWEGPMSFTGTSSGKGYLEMTGYE